jgi:phosphoserine aminotransferase
MTKDGKLIESLFTGATINTPSMLCVVDYLDALEWVQSVGGIQGTIAICDANLAVISDFVDTHPWINFLAKDATLRSNTSVCLSLDLSAKEVKAITTLLEQHKVAFDIGAYRDAPAGLRIWCGSTIEKANLETLCVWLEWAYFEVKNANS